jgi:hypothetical protein
LLAARYFWIVTYVTKAARPGGEIRRAAHFLMKHKSEVPRQPTAESVTLITVSGSNTGPVSRELTFTVLRVPSLKANRNNCGPHTTGFHDT